MKKIAMTIEQHLAQLQPDFAAHLRVKWIAAQMVADADDVDIKIVCSLRSQAEQAKLYAQGRTIPGPRVTWTLRSKHSTGNAVDFGLFRDGRYMDAIDNTLCYKVYQKISKVLAHPQLTWLGHVGDPCHFQWAPKKNAQ
jgi:peptidoglycan L-alanyl-D-glutamate endopeptidase CwlK